MGDVNYITEDEMIPRFGLDERVVANIAGEPLRGFVSGMRTRSGVEQYELSTDAGGYFWFDVDALTRDAS